MPDAGLDFALAVRVAHSAWQCHAAIVTQHIAVQGIEGRIVSVRRKHAFAQIIENYDAGCSPEAKERFLVQLSPDARIGAEGQ